MTFASSIVWLLALLSTDSILSSQACQFHEGATQQPAARQLLGDVPIVEECGTVPLSLEEKLEMAQAVENWKVSRSEPHRQLATSNSSNFTITIPVYFHILQYDEVIGKMNRSTITDIMMPTLNKAYSDTPFRFVFKKATHTIYPDFHNCSKGYVEYSFKSLLRRGGTNALNAFVCNAYGAGVAAWSTYPLVAATRSYSVMDGIVLQNPELFGTYLSDSYSLVHETGHWLGLLHTFEDGCATNLTNTDDDLSVYNNLVGDGVADTPSHANPTSDYPGYATCWQDASLDTCDDSIPFIDKGFDPVDNFMNYNGPICRELYGRFTPGQIERMVAQFETYRAVDPNKKCHAKRKPCRRNSRCCIGLTCISDKVGKKRGTCQKCRYPGSKCTRNSDCCYGPCNVAKGVCKVPKN